LDITVGEARKGAEPPMKRKKKREVEGLRFAQWKTPRKRGRLTKLPTAAHLGVKFERAWAEYMYNVEPMDFSAGPWIYYEDINGWGYCQPDGVLKDGPDLILFECKLSFTYRTAYTEMNKLYAPLLERLMDVDSIKRVQVCRHLKPSAKRTTVVRTLDEVYKCPKTQLTWAWQPTL